MTQVRTILKWLGWGTLSLLSLLIIYVVIDCSNWPVYRLSRVTEITKIQFPAGSKLVTAHHQKCIGESLDAKVVMPRAALASFLHQPKVRLVPKTFMPNNSATSLHPTYFFENGNPTSFVLSFTDAQFVTVEVTMDEP